MFAPEVPDDFPDIPERPWDPDDPDDDEQLINSFILRFFLYDFYICSEIRSRIYYSFP